MRILISLGNSAPEPSPQYSSLLQEAEINIETYNSMFCMQEIKDTRLK